MSNVCAVCMRSSYSSITERNSHGFQSMPHRFAYISAVLPSRSLALTSAPATTKSLISSGLESSDAIIKTVQPFWALAFTSAPSSISAFAMSTLFIPATMDSNVNPSCGALALTSAPALTRHFTISGLSPSRALNIKAVAPWPFVALTSAPNEISVSTS